VDDAGTAPQWPPAAAEARAVPRLGACFVLLFLLWVLLLLVGRGLPGLRETLGPSPWPFRGAVAITTAVVALLAGKARRTLYWTLTSLPFSIALLCAFLVTTILGTLVLQGAAPEEYVRRYGTAVAPLLLGLGLDDPFHTFWFRGLLGLLTVTLLLVGTRRAVWRPPLWGHMVSHLGVVAVLVGGAIGNIAGYRGFIDIHEGEVVDELDVTQGGRRTGEKRPLGFELRLDDFEIERYGAEFRVYAYEPKGDSLRMFRSWAPSELSEWTSAVKGGAQFRVSQVWPDYFVTQELRTVAPGAGRPVLELTIDPGPGKRQVRLFDGVQGRDTIALDGDDRTLRFAWVAPNAEELEHGGPRPERRVLEYATGDDPPRQIEIQEGLSYSLAEETFHLTVRRYLPDFVINEAREKVSRSDVPNNPALLVAVTHSGHGEAEKPEERWLFAKNPDFDRQQDRHTGDLRLVFRHFPAQAPPERELVVVGGTRELLRLERGRLVERGPLDEGLRSETPGIASWRVVESALEHGLPGTRSQEWLHPAVEIELREGERISSDVVIAGHTRPFWLPDQSALISFEQKPNDVKDYRSHVSVLENGVEQRKVTIEVNAPLAQAGLHLYQTSYREEDPTYSGLQVVRDPGFSLVFVGFTMMSLGLAYIYYVRPRLLRKGIV